MTSIVRGLEEAGLVRRETDPSDGRVVRVHATTKGESVLQRARERRIANLAERLATLTDDEIADVHAAAELVERALAQEP
jgi:DNA-binding MarR family transcriptional regulator